MNEDELESKSIMIYINEETINKLKEYPSIEEKDPITGEWTISPLYIYTLTLQLDNNLISTLDNN